ncbi:MAG TPA: hypothetical protein PK199_05355, partial [Bacteroidales bacterium]|nr:hypothetical protein [Bacteroidales bacterium]
MKIVSTFVFFAFCVMQSLAQGSFLCPVPAPEVIQPDPICVYDETPEITATIGSYWGDGIRPTPTIPVQFKFYNSPTDFVPIEVNTTGKFTPYINKSEEKEYTYYVSEYNSNVLPQACEGPRTAVTISVKKVLPASLNPVSDVCAMPEGMNPTFIAYDYTGTIEWHPIAPPIPATTGSVAIGSLFQPSFTTLGIHTVWAVVRNNGCVSEPVSGSYVIKPIPAAPTVP